MLTTTNTCNIAAMENEFVEIGQKIAQARERNGMSQSDLARALNITPQAVQKWETLFSRPRLHRVYEIAGALGVTVEELVRGTELERIIRNGSALSQQIRSQPQSPLNPLRWNDFDEQPPPDRVPVITWEQAGHWPNRIQGGVKSLVPCPFVKSNEAFALEIVNDMNYDPAGEKSYAPGDVIVVDPSVIPENRSMVIIITTSDDDEHRASLRQILLDEHGNTLSKGLNPKIVQVWAPLADNSEILGTVIGKWRAE